VYKHGGHTYSSKDIELLEKVQRRATRTMTNEVYNRYKVINSQHFNVDFGKFCYRADTVVLPRC